MLQTDTGFLIHQALSAMTISLRSSERSAVLAVGVSLDKPEDDPERRIAIINDQGREIGTVPVYSKPSYENPAK
jgi:hypothetical protein